MKFGRVYISFTLESGDLDWQEDALMPHYRYVVRSD